jgi:hypothetical protein
MNLNPAVAVFQTPADTSQRRSHAGAYEKIADMAETVEI